MRSLVYSLSCFQVWQFFQESRVCSFQNSNSDLDSISKYTVNINDFNLWNMLTVFLIRMEWSWIILESCKVECMLWTLTNPNCDWDKTPVFNYLQNMAFHGVLAIWASIQLVHTWKRHVRRLRRYECKNAIF